MYNSVVVFFMCLLLVFIDAQYMTVVEQFSS